MGTQAVAQLSNNLVYSAIVVYALAMLAFAADVAFGRRPAEALVGSREGAAPADAPADADGAADGAADGGDRYARVAASLTVLAFGLHAAGVLARAVAAGRVPWGNMYEFAISAALAVTGVYLVLVRRYDVRFLGLVVVPAVLLTLGLAVAVLYTEAGELVPALQSVWLVVHVLAAVVSAGAFTVGAALSVLYLLRSRADRRGGPDRQAGGWTGRLPAAERLDRLAYRVHAFVFPIWTFAVVAGAIWAENAWGRYWGWDPKETWAFITWVLYAAYLHARATAGWRGGRAAGIALLGFAALLFNYVGINLWITGLHSYAGVG